MSINFETKLNDLHADIISISMEYCNHQCDEAFVHVIYESDVLFVDFFFRINGEMRRKSRLSDDGKTVDAKRQQKTLSIIIDDVRNIISLLKSHGRPIPTEMRLVLNNKTNAFTADYCYDETICTTSTDRTVSDEWFNQLKTFNHKNAEE